MVGTIRIDNSREADGRAMACKMARGETSARRGASAPSVVDEARVRHGAARLLAARECVLASRGGERPRWDGEGAAVLVTPERRPPGDGRGVGLALLSWWAAGPRGSELVAGRDAEWGDKRDSNGTRRSEPPFHAAGSRTLVTPPRSGSRSPFDTATRWSRDVACWPRPRQPGTNMEDGFASSAAPLAAAGYGLKALPRIPSLASPAGAIGETGDRARRAPSANTCDDLDATHGEDGADAIRFARVGPRG